MPLRGTGRWGTGRRKSSAELEEALRRAAERETDPRLRPPTPPRPGAASGGGVNPALVPPRPPSLEDVERGLTPEQRQRLEAELLRRAQELRERGTQPGKATSKVPSFAKGGLLRGRKPAATKAGTTRRATGRTTRTTKAKASASKGKGKGKSGGSRSKR